MAISTEQLESIKQQLLVLAKRLTADPRSSDSELPQNDPLVAQALECDFILPSPLSMATPSVTVRRKLETVDVLLDRARLHRTLPAEAQAAAEEDNRFLQEDYQDEPALPGTNDSDSDSGGKANPAP